MKLINAKASAYAWLGTPAGGRFNMDDYEIKPKTNTMKKQTHKMDQHLIATGQKYEIDHVIRKFKLIGIAVTSSQVKAAAKKCNNSRQRTYNLLREKSLLINE